MPGLYINLSWKLQHVLRPVHVVDKDAGGGVCAQGFQGVCRNDLNIVWKVRCRQAAAKLPDNAQIRAQCMQRLTDAARIIGIALAGVAGKERRLAVDSVNGVKQAHQQAAPGAARPV